MKLIIADTAGFCHGVQRAVDICREAAATHPGCVTFGPIIHNKHVIHELEELGVHSVSDASDLHGSPAVIIRSHGIGRKTYGLIAEKGTHVIDATCPNVKHLHDIVETELTSGRTIIIIGEHSHPEVSALLEYGDDMHVFKDAAELSSWLGDGKNADKPISLVFQTTNTEDVYCDCVEMIKKVCTNHKVFDTICKATFKRQQEAKRLSKIADVMVVVGDSGSSNSLRLTDICAKSCSRVLFVQSPEDLRNADIKATDTVGVTAGASTPAWIIKEVTQKMSDETFPEAVCEDIETISEQPEPGTGEDTLAVVETVDEAPAEVEAVVEARDEVEAIDETVDEAPAEVEAVVEAPAEVEAVVEAPAEVEAVVEARTEVEAIDETVNEAPTETETVVETPAVIVAVVEASAEDEAKIEAQGFAHEFDDMENGAAESFEEMLEKSIKTLRAGEKVSGIVTSVTATEVSVDLGAKQSGYIPISEFLEDAGAVISDVINVGDTIEAFVMRVNDVEGMVMLSKKRLDAIKNWDLIEAAKDTRAIMEGIVSEENKGGVVVNIKGVRVFVPASQTGLPKAAAMSELLKKPVKLRITEVNQSRRRVVGSIRSANSDERREKSDHIWNEIETGKRYDGVVKSMTSYGVFVDIGGVDGMIHISELSWTRVKQPSDVMSIGDEVSVYVLSFDKENKKISLGYRNREDDPWNRFARGNAIGDTVSVKIVKMVPFGAFAEIMPGIDGLIHISQITDHRIGLPSEILSHGQIVDAKITDIDNEHKKVSLSIKALIDPSSQPVTDAEAEEASFDKDSVVVYDTDAPPQTDAESAE